MNTFLFSQIMADKGFSVRGLSIETEIPASRLVSILEGATDITVTEIRALSEAMALTDRQRRAVFFNRKFAIRLSYGLVNAYNRQPSL